MSQSTSKSQDLCKTEMIKLYLLITFLVGTSLSQIACPEKTYYRISERKCDEYKNVIAKEERQWGLLFSTTCKKKSYLCGSVGQTGLIVGGYPAKIGEFPHMAAIGWRLDDDTVAFRCGGSLISERFVLTAAHCSPHGDDGPPDFVQLGTRNLAESGPDSAPLERNITRFIKHPKYDSLKLIHDIALIELDQDVTFDKVHRRPACLQQEEFYGENVTATGWGRLKTYAETSDQLMKVVLPVNNIEVCRDKLESKRLSATRQICAGGEHGKDTCEGDSGAPIQWAHSDAQCVYNIIGITSFGNALCGQKAPSVYTKVEHYLDWIEGRVWPE